MQRPISLSIILVLWFANILFALYTVGYILLITGSGLLNTTGIITLAIALLVFALIIFFSKALFDLWKGKKSGVKTVVIFSIIFLISGIVAIAKSTENLAVIVLPIVTFLILRKQSVKMYLQ